MNAPTLLSTEVQIQEHSSIPGMGGLNFNYLRELGWSNDGWFPVVRTERAGVYIQLPKRETPLFVRSHQIAAQRPRTTAA